MLDVAKPTQLTQSGPGCDWQFALHQTAPRLLNGIYGIQADSRNYCSHFDVEPRRHFGGLICSNLQSSRQEFWSDTGCRVCKKLQLILQTCNLSVSYLSLNSLRTSTLPRVLKWSQNDQIPHRTESAPRLTPGSPIKLIPQRSKPAALFRENVDCHCRSRTHN